MKYRDVVADGRQLKAGRVLAGLSAEIKSRNLDCDPAALACSAKGFKKGTKKFSQCKANETAEYSIQAQKRANPAFGYCIDSGFKTGTDAMATCMSAYNQERHNQFIFERQQKLFREEMHQRAAEERARHSNPRPELLPIIVGNPTPTPQLSLPESPARTECFPNLSGGFNCTTYK